MRGKPRPKVRGRKARDVGAVLGIRLLERLGIGHVPVSVGSA